jgi:hypothetical protein
MATIATARAGCGWALACGLSLGMGLGPSTRVATAQDAESLREAREIRSAFQDLQDAVAKAGRAPRASRALPPASTTGLVPLDELGRRTYQGRQGGLYPGGSNERPARHEEAGRALAREVRPLDREGRPAADGKIVLLSIGMSNTTQEFSVFQSLANSDPDRNPRLAIVDGAQGGMAANVVSRPDSPRGAQFWQTVADRLARAGVTPAQVQVAWIKQADPGPTAPFPDVARTLQGELETIVRLAKEKFPNLRLAYLSSRTYGGYATTPLNPEPFAYESGFAVKWLIEKQIDGSPELNYSAARGPGRAPWLSWGPYLWADGTKARRDGLSYARSDFAQDGTHPAPGGARDKVARRLLDFFKSDPTARPWFLARP